MKIAALVMLAIVAGCNSAPPRTIDEQLAKQVVFTVSKDIKIRPETKSSLSSTSFRHQEPSLSEDLPQVMIEGVLRFHRLRKISQWTISALGVEAVVAEVPQKSSIEDIIERLSEDTRVESVQSVKSYTLLTYNDPYYELQSSVRGDGIENVHRLATGKDVVVAVVDTGIDRSHPEISDRVIYSKNLVAHDAARFDMDEHGTAVAGVIGSSANNELGIVGVAPDVKIMALKACWEGEGGRHARCDSASLTRAMIEVINQQPDIVNLSLAGPSDPLMSRLIRYATRQGVVVLAAVDSAAPESFPAAMPEVIAVGTLQSKLQTERARGIIAPGTDVLTTTPGATYAFKSGSSIATAYVAGIAALMKERQPALSGEQIRLRLRNTATGAPGTEQVVNMCAAITLAGESCADDYVVAELPQAE